MLNKSDLDLYRKSINLQANGQSEILSSLDKEEKKLHDFETQLNTRKTKLAELSRALNSASLNINKNQLLRLLEPLNETVRKIHIWLTGAITSLSNLNKEIKNQNQEFNHAISGAFA